MDHDTVVRQKTTERYLLDELDPQARDEFEQHYFECQDCALDVHAGAMFVEHTKVVLAEKPALDTNLLPAPAPVKPGWLAWLRPGLRPIYAAPVLALLLAVIGYQNLVTYPLMRASSNSPRILPFASVNVGTWGSGGSIVTARPGEGFLLFVRIPPDGSYSSYTAELRNPSDKVEWSLAIPVAASPDRWTQDRAIQDRTIQDQWPIQVPGADRKPGSYNLVVRGVTATGESKEVGRASFELQIHK
jgi:hypothetical protein